MTQRKIWIIALVVYTIILFYFAVIGRDMVQSLKPVRFILFERYTSQDCSGYSDIYNNIALFIPLGVVVGLLVEKYKMLKTSFFGLLLSLTIEFSQLYFKRGIFDVDDLFDNTIGALIGGLLIAMVIKFKKRYNKVG